MGGFMSTPAQPEARQAASSNINTQLQRAAAQLDQQLAQRVADAAELERELPALIQRARVLMGQMGIEANAAAEARRREEPNSSSNDADAVLRAKK